MDDSDAGVWIFFWLIIGAVVGGAIGASRNNVGSGVVWGALLGPIGWILVLFLDERPKCPECRGPLSEDARRCQHCGFEFGVSKYSPQRSQSSEPLNKNSSAESDKKKCPFCAELIQREAIKCRFCGSDLPKVPAKTEQSPETKSASKNIDVIDVKIHKPIEKESVAQSAVSHIPCPLCSQHIRISLLKRGENFCPHCFEKFVAE